MVFHRHKFLQADGQECAGGTEFKQVMEDAGCPDADKV
jgi:rubredoxin